MLTIHFIYEQFNDISTTGLQSGLDRRGGRLHGFRDLQGGCGAENMAMVLIYKMGLSENRVYSQL